MQTSYLYSVSRVNTLAQYLLSKTDVERLLVAEAGADLESALKETYLAPYLLRSKEGKVREAIEWTLIDAKKLIHSIAPQGNMFRVLWSSYDIHNLRVFAKAKAAQQSFDAIEHLTSRRGIYEPQYLYTATEAGTLHYLQPGWQAAYDEAVQMATTGALDKVDGVLDQALFATKRRIASLYPDAFITRFVTTSIDLYNLSSRLRILVHPEVPFTATFIDGGSFTVNEIETKEAIFAKYARIRPTQFWQAAFASYETTGNTTQLDARAHECLMALAKEASTDMFSSASLVLYYLRCQQSARNIRTIFVGKTSGMDIEEIRANLTIMYAYE